MRDTFRGIYSVLDMKAKFAKYHQKALFLGEVIIYGHTDYSYVLIHLYIYPITGG